MDISKVTISCTKSDCPGGASLHQTSCGVCGTPITKRYLQLLNPRKNYPASGSLIAGRYWVTGNPEIVLDTQPQETPVITDEFPPEIEAYLRLSPHLLHCPQVFGLTGAEEGFWLLEYPSVSLEPSGLPVYPDLFASVLEAWKSANPLQQLNWLDQIASLLPDFLQVGAVGTFYDFSLLGINGGAIQVRRLLFDQKQTIDFQKLGQVWRELLETTPHKSIKGFCHRLYQELTQGKINQPPLLQHILRAGITQLGRSHYKYRYSLYTQTDSGPTRDHNEDACFPAAGKLHTQHPLAIVCDGIGGHDKGEVASAIAIETLQQQLLQEQAQTVTPDQAFNLLKEAILQANDAITNQNDEEHRRERERMGTTLVMAWAQHPHVYLCHVGDSRIYRITPESCHQVTFDDDLGSREVRLGYALYQDALNYPSAGALIQALGMSPSRSLHPTVQRLTPDTDTVYLLCSDGLSDYGRVEQYWRSEILPVLAKQRDLATAGENLIAIANQKNGHDNATIALLHVQLQPQPNAQAIAYPTIVPTAEPSPDSTISNPGTPVTQPSVVPVRKNPHWMLILLGLLGVTGIGLLSWRMWERAQMDNQGASPPATTVIEPKPIPEEPLSPPPIAIPEGSDNPGEPSPLTKNQILQLQRDGGLTAYYTPEAIAEPGSDSLWIPGGSIVRVEQINADNRVLLEVCELGQQTPPPNVEKAIAVGNRGWSSINLINRKQDTNFVVEDETICSATEADPGTPPTPSN